MLTGVVALGGGIAVPAEARVAKAASRGAALDLSQLEAHFDAAFVGWLAAHETRASVRAAAVDAMAKVPQGPAIADYQTRCRRVAAFSILSPNAERTYVEWVIKAFPAAGWPRVAAAASKALAGGESAWADFKFGGFGWAYFDDLNAIQAARPQPTDAVAADLAYIASLADAPGAMERRLAENAIAADTTVDRVKTFLTQSWAEAAFYDLDHDQSAAINGDCQISEYSNDELATVTAYLAAVEAGAAAAEQRQSALANMRAVALRADYRVKDWGTARTAALAQAAHWQQVAGAAQVTKSRYWTQIGPYAQVLVGDWTALAELAQERASYWADRSVRAQAALTALQNSISRIHGSTAR